MRGLTERGEFRRHTRIGELSGRWYDLDECLRAADGTFTIRVSDTPQSAKVLVNNWHARSRACTHRVGV